MYYPPPYGYGYKQPTSIKTILIITVIVLVVIVGAYFYIKKSAEKALKEELPSEYADEKYTAAESKQIRYLSTAIKDDLSKYIQLGHNLDIYKQLRNASDRVFVGVTVDYKRLAGESFRTSMNDASGFGFNLSDGFWGESSEVYDAIIGRLNSLQIA